MIYFFRSLKLLTRYFLTTEAQEAFSQEVAVFEAEKRNNKSENTYVLEESSQMRVDIHGAHANIQDSIAADDISFETCIESQINTEAPEYTQEELPSPPDLISEPTVTSKTYEGHYEVRPVDIKTNQIGFLGRYIVINKNGCHCMNMV